MTKKRLLLLTLFSSVILHAQTPYEQGVKEFQAKNYSEALRYYFIAARAHDVNAYLELGKIHQYGVGTGINPQTAYYWYEKAAMQNNHEAQYRIGYLYENGLGLVQDSTKAAEWYRKAAAGGYQKAKDRLAGKPVKEEIYITTVPKEEKSLFDNFTLFETDKNDTKTEADKESNKTSLFSFLETDKNETKAGVAQESNKTSPLFLTNKSADKTETNNTAEDSNDSISEKLLFWK